MPKVKKASSWMGGQQVGSHRVCRRKAEKRSALKSVLKAELIDQKHTAFLEALKTELELKDLPTSSSDADELFDTLFQWVRKSNNPQTQDDPDPDAVKKNGPDHQDAIEKPELELALEADQ